MKTMIQSFFVVAALLQIQTAFAQEQAGACHSKTQLAAIKPYTMNFKETVVLNQNEANAYYNLRLSSGRASGCVIFSLVPTLNGVYTAKFAERLNANKAKEECSTKLNYEYMQFVDADNKPVFRLQCDYIAYEDQDPQPRAPDVVTARSLQRNNPKVLGNVEVN